MISLATRSLRLALTVAAASGLSFGTVSAAAQGYDQDYQQGYVEQRYAEPGDVEQGDPQAIGSVRDFEAPLAAYGRWVDTGWGRAWSPRVERDWRPYTIGQWIDDPQYGLTWASDEPWGWATYHYGRWGYDRRYGWVWVPGTEWGPAWVAWRDGDDYTGWAPLPPETGNAAGIAIALGIGAALNAWDYDRWYGPSWVYVPRRSFGHAYQRRDILPWDYRRHRDYWNRTRGVTHYVRDNGRVINRSIGDGNFRPRPPGIGQPGYGRPGSVRPGYVPGRYPPGVYYPSRDARPNDANQPGRPGWASNGRPGRYAYGERRPGDSRSRPNDVGSRSAQAGNRSDSAAGARSWPDARNAAGRPPVSPPGGIAGRRDPGQPGVVPRQAGGRPAPVPAAIPAAVAARPAPQRAPVAGPAVTVSAPGPAARPAPPAERSRGRERAKPE